MKNIQTYKYGEKQQKAKEKQRAIKCRLHITMLHAITQYSTHHYSTNTNLKRIRCNFTENIFGTGELKIERLNLNYNRPSSEWLRSYTFPYLTQGQLLKVIRKLSSLTLTLSPNRPVVFIRMQNSSTEF